MDHLRRTGLPRLLPVVVAVTTLDLVLMVTLVLRRPGSALAQTVGDLSILAATMLALACCVAAARRGGPEARGWGLLAVAVAVWSAGQLVWTAYGQTRAHVYPFPSAADALYLAYAAPAVLALLAFPRASRQRVSRLRQLLDAAVITASLLFVSWATVLRPLHEQTQLDLTGLVTQAYPVLDATLASVVLTVGMLAPVGRRRTWLLLGLGLVLLTVTDSTYVLRSLQGATAPSGGPLALGWIGAFLLLAAASRVPLQHGTTAPVRQVSVVQELLPVVPLVSAALVAGATQIDTQDTFLLVTGGLLIALALAQQVVLAVEKARLTAGLEATIETRTTALTSADARYRSLVESSDDAIISKAPGGAITSWNAAAERLFGYTEQEMLGQTVELLMPAGHERELAELKEHASRPAEPQRSYATERRRKDGSVVPVGISISPIAGERGFEGVSIIARDISETLARERDLVAARAQALAALEAKTEFLATMSHEIRTPMNGVLGLTGLLLSTPLDALQHRYVSGVQGAGQALLAIIDDILDFSKLEAGKVETEQVELDLRALLSDVEALLAGQALGKGLTVTACCAPSVPPTLLGDPGRLRQVLVNLVGNAVKFTESGGVQIRAEAAPSDVQGRWTVVLEVVDTGIGIAEHDVARLFEPFSQADASTTRRFGGTGLGLAICRRLLEAMGGDLQVLSAPGLGSTFRVTLELAAGTAAGAGKVASAEYSPGRGAVLVVEDNEVNQLVAQGLLEQLGYSVTVVKDGEQALAVLDTTRFAAVLMDCHMPGMDGLQATRELRRREGTAHRTPVIAMSAGVVASDRDRCVAAGMDDFVGKPVDLDHLRVTLARWTGRTDGAPALAARS